MISYQVIGYLDIFLYLLIFIHLLLSNLLCNFIWVIIIIHLNCHFVISIDSLLILFNHRIMIRIECYLIEVLLVFLGSLLDFYYESFDFIFINYIFYYSVIKCFMILFNLLRITFYCIDRIVFVVSFTLFLVMGSFISMFSSRWEALELNNI